MSRVTRYESNDTMMRDILDLLRRQRALVFWVMVLCLVAAGVVGAFTHPVYRSQVELLVEGRTQNNPEPGLGDPLNQVTTEAPPAYDMGTIVEMLESQSVVSRTYAEAFNDAYKADGPVRLKEATLKHDESVLPSVYVEQVGPTNILIASIESTDWKLCQPTAARLSDALGGFLSDIRLNQLAGARNQMAKSLIRERQYLAAAEWDMATFEKDKSVMDAEVERPVRAESASRADVERAMAERDYQAALKKLSAAMAARAALPPYQDSVSTNSNTANIEAQKKVIADLVAQREPLAAIYQPTSTEIRKLDAQIQKETDYLNSMPKNLVVKTRIRNPLIDTFDTQIAQAQMELKAADAAAIDVGAWANAKTKGLKDYSNTLARQAKLQRRIEDEQNRVTMLEKNLAELRARAADVRAPAQTLGSADTPKQIKPNWIRNFALAILVGIALSLSLAVVRDRGGDRVVSLGETDELLGALPLGYIPALPRKALQAITPSGSIDPEVKALPGKTMTVPEVALESYRILRANFNYSTQGDPIRSVLVTSTNPGEGKSTVASNLAVAMAADGKRVILVDCNLRRPTLHKTFNLCEAPGIADVLLGRGSLNDVLLATTIPGLSVIPAGMQTLTGSELFGSPAMKDLHKEIVENSDIAIFDGAQCARVADAQVLSSVADGVLYVVQLGVPKKASMRFGIGLLNRAGARILGVVYNKLSVNEDNAPKVS